MTELTASWGKEIDNLTMTKQQKNTNGACPQAALGAQNEVPRQEKMG